MVNNISALPASKLKELKAGETITIFFAETETSVRRVIDDSFPKAVATTFSNKWAEVFPPINKIKVTDLQKPRAKSVTIIGGTLELHTKILAWMLSCCEGQGLRPFESYEVKPFSKYFMLRDSARIMGCDILEKELKCRMEGIVNHQVHSEDVRALYLRLPKGHEMLKFLAHHVATLIFEKGLRARSAYETVREEIPAFNEDLNELLNAMVAQRKQESATKAEQKKAVREEKMQYQSEKPQIEKGKAARGVRARKTNSTMKGDTKHEGKDLGTKTKAAGVEKSAETGNDGRVHVNLLCDVVRRGKKGRPTYARLDLAQIGVSKEGFMKREYRGARGKRAAPRPTDKSRRSSIATATTNTMAEPNEKPSKGLGDATAVAEETGGAATTAHNNTKQVNGGRKSSGRNVRRRQEKHQAATVDSTSTTVIDTTEHGNDA